MTTSIMLEKDYITTSKILKKDYHLERLKDYHLKNMVLKKVYHLKGLPFVTYQLAEKCFKTLENCQ